VVTVTFYSDGGEGTTQEAVSEALAGLFGYAHQWALEEPPEETTMRFSSMLAAMVAGADPWCAWLRMHLALRGVESTLMTKSRAYPRMTQLPAKLSTTRSFRQALAEARRLYDAAGRPEGGLGVRQFMAAYAVIHQYHLQDFLRLRIDRRAWCLDLAGQLAVQFPAEKAVWEAYARLATPVPLPGFETDAPDGRDLLNVEREVEAFAMLIASRRTLTPLSIGVFGGWGSGKSFFMRRVRERVAAISAVGRQEGRASRYHGQTAQIEFNAWHYSEGNLIACLVDHIFRNLRFDAGDEDEVVLRQRGADVLMQIESAEQTLDARRQELREAESRIAEAKHQVEETEAKIHAEIKAKTGELDQAQSKLKDAREKLGEGLEKLRLDIEAAVAKVPAASIVGLLKDQLLGDTELVKASGEFRGLVQDAKRANGRRKMLFWGVVVGAAGFVAAAAVRTEVWIKITSGAAGLGAFAAMAHRWLKKLSEIADSGERFQAKQQEMAQQAAAKVTEAHGAALASMRKLTEERLAEVQALQTELERMQEAPAAARLDLAAFEQTRADALAQRAKAEVEVETKKQALARLTTGRLLEEFLNDRVSTDGYRRELTIFTQVRNDFERLSRLMSRATEKYYEGQGDAPAVSRIVLYIDDLDRCPADVVVKVLRVVHLLLAFPLFVCVVAVDPRWLTDCLRNAPGLVRDPDQKEMALAQLGDQATTADYLEKIFQIPLWLRPIPRRQRPALVRALLEAAGTRSAAHRNLPPMVATGAAAHGGSPDDGERERPAQMVDHDTPNVVELEYLDKLQGLFDGNPRALKRFVNTYRLVKTALSDVELEVFLKARVRQEEVDVTYQPYRICMAQLAVLCTQRPRALALVRHADRDEGNGSLGDWLNSLAEQGEDVRELASCLREALSEDGKLTLINFDTFQQWLERTRRYSFYV
jgi:KAP family P-loop domain